MKNKDELYKITYEDIENVKDWNNLIKTELIYLFLEKNNMTKEDLCELSGISIDDLEMLLSETPNLVFDCGYKVSEAIGIDGCDIFNL